VQGRLAEVLGANFIGRDAMTRRIQYRGDIDAEWASYGPGARAIATAFVRGINAWVAIARERPPAEFVLAGWLPETWRAEDLLNRTDAFRASGDGAAEVFRARLAATLGSERAAALLGEDAATGSPAIDLAAITYHVGDALREIGTPPFFAALGGPVNGASAASALGAVAGGAAGGSNAWAIAGGRSTTGAPLLAVDPHRRLANPSERYLIHLTAPGWNVAGATSPWLPGVVIGHNDRVAWGMTAADDDAADGADLYVERLNPDDPHQVERDGRWEKTVVVQGSLRVKGRDRPEPFDREYTSRGVVVVADRERHLAVTLRWSGMEPGGAGELAALGLNRAGSADDLRDALTRWQTPAVEVVFVDRAGGVGSQVAARVPIRRGRDGRLPAAAWRDPIDWDGWRGLDDQPHASASAGTDSVGAGYVASANGNHARTARLQEALSAGSLSVQDFANLQHDVKAWNATRLVPLFARLRSDRSDVEQARRQLLDWNRQVSGDSVSATIYVTWERLVREMLAASRVPAVLVDEFVSRTTNMLVPALTLPSRLWFDGNASAARDRLIMNALAAAVDELHGRSGGVAGAATGNDIPPWGRLQQVMLAHPLGITEAARRRFNLGPFARPGYAETLMVTAQRRGDAALGASFAAVFDTADWDRSIVQNAPGQSESPGSRHFADLAMLWGDGKYFPLAFSEAAVAAHTESTLELTPPMVQRSTR
jgi:penicillin amidase